ncbi:MAG: hypothetical protein KHZ62_09080 [Clostridiales bacterium]|nr:hypothetical protein [Clostridiales bacterium]
MTYRYLCPNCGKVEIKRPISQYNPKEKCPTCGSEMARDITNFCCTSSRNCKDFFGIAKK